MLMDREHECQWGNKAVRNLEFLVISPYYNPRFNNKPDSFSKTD